MMNWCSAVRHMFIRYSDRQTDRQTDRHFGCWGEKAEDYLKKLSQLSRDKKTESQLYQPSRHTGDLCFLCVYNDQLLE